MEYSLQEIGLVAAVMTLGSVVQGTVAFASGLISVPLLVLCGYSLVEATVVNFISTALQNAAGAIQLRSHVKFEEVTWPVLLRGISMPLGVLALSVTSQLDQNLVRQLVGCVLLISVFLLVCLRSTPRDRLGFGWIGLAFLSSGFLMGFASIGGAPMVLYVNSLNWSAVKSRAFLFFCSAALVPLMGIALCWQFGGQLLAPASLAATVTPSCLAGLWLGLAVGRRLDKVRFRRITYSLLFIVAIVAIAAPVVFKGR